jgi:hypothetical protein
MLAREQLQDLLAGGVDRESNTVSALVERVTRLVARSCSRPSSQTSLRPGPLRRPRRGPGRLSNGYQRGRLRTAEGFVDVAVPQVRGTAEPFRSSLMGFLDGNSEVLELLLNEMHGRCLSTRAVRTPSGTPTWSC